MVRRLREAGSRAYIIILTAYDSFAYAQTAIRLGAVDFLLKPFHDGDLENAVLALQKRIAAQTAPQPEPLPGVKPAPRAAMCARQWCTLSKTAAAAICPSGRRQRSWD